jgi:hypothetical protein
VAQQLPALTDQLGQIMNMCHAVYGQMSGAHSMSSQSTLLMNRSFSEATGVRERAATTAAMRWALRFVPLVMHEASVTPDTPESHNQSARVASSTATPKRAPNYLGRRCGASGPQ